MCKGMERIETTLFCVVLTQGRTTISNIWSDYEVLGGREVGVLREKILKERPDFEAFSRPVTELEFSIGSRS